MADESDALQREERELKRSEEASRAEERRRAQQLKRLKQVERRAGEAGKKIGGEVGGRGGQLVGGGAGAITGGAVGLGAGIVAAPFTGGTSLVGAPMTGARIGGMAGGKAGYLAGKYGVGRPLGKQIGKAPFRPLVARRRHQMRAAGREADVLREARRGVALERQELGRDWLNAIVNQAEKAAWRSVRFAFKRLLLFGLAPLMSFIIVCGLVVALAVMLT